MDMHGKTAFITGGASGIGLAIAQRCAAEGMTLLIADIEEGALAGAAATLRAEGATVFTYRLDVADLDRYRAVAAAVIADHGAPFLLVNNAGIAWKAPASAATPEDWRWTISVNVLGLGYGLSLFVPAMIAGGQGGYVLNTASITGLIVSPGGSAVYSASKHAVVAISETLAHELRPHGIHVAVLCPGSVATNITDADRNLPADLTPDALSSAAAEERAFTRSFVDNGIAPAAVADQAFAALAERRFYVVTHPEYRDEIETRHRQIEAAVRGEPASDVALLAMAKQVLNLQPLT
ncbi:SDR family NAD(P)-dependent oxidoreductase [Sphingomonas sp. RP10(2022)]|uniref:SDR family NAD(P)-dependent oxidoreductase n=1 Tax=Sphingomonas liriopis TaxID=2949094 RepID=A0A9X2HPX4_9SPHN|nr:SDR family NAD(P)-dependent oxidoreductase [Sphingomonas liriopis]MCP3734282.1 SDR family NAD(P)-dependent oxidoreductase [Sphingomonas liriopis]